MPAFVHSFVFVHEVYSSCCKLVVMSVKCISQVASKFECTKTLVNLMYVLRVHIFWNFAHLLLYRLKSVFLLMQSKMDDGKIISGRDHLEFILQSSDDRTLWLTAIS